MAKKEIEVGNLYDMNKNIIQQKVKPLTIEELEEKKKLISDFMNNDEGNFYYMLLCHERRDYTVFEYYDCTKWEERCNDCAKCIVDECLATRGEIRAISLTEAKDAVEI